MSERRYQSFDEFWPHYVREHSKPETQAIHAVGTALAVTAVAAATVTRRGWLVPAGIAAGYACAWFSHFTIEGNKPATFHYPLWSFAADFKMLGKILRGEMTEEVRRAHAMQDDPDPAAPPDITIQ